MSLELLFVPTVIATNSLRKPDEFGIVFRMGRFTAGALLSLVDHFMRHSSEQSIGVTDASFRNSNLVLMQFSPEAAVVADVEAMARNDELHLVGVGQAPTFEGRR